MCSRQFTPCASHRSWTVRETLAQVRRAWEKRRFASDTTFIPDPPLSALTQISRACAVVVPALGSMGFMSWAVCGFWLSFIKYVSGMYGGSQLPLTRRLSHSQLRHNGGDCNRAGELVDDLSSTPRHHSPHHSPPLLPPSLPLHPALPPPPLPPPLPTACCGVASRRAPRRRRFHARTAPLRPAAMLRRGVPQTSHAGAAQRLARWPPRDRAKQDRKRVAGDGSGIDQPSCQRH